MTKHLVMASAMVLTLAGCAREYDGLPGVVKASEPEAIEYETADGKWHTETAEGSDRPDTDVEDKP